MFWYSVELEKTVQTQLESTKSKLKRRSYSQNTLNGKILGDDVAEKLSKSTQSNSDI